MSKVIKWLGDAMAHALGAIEDKHLVPPPIGPQPYRDTPSKRNH